MQAKQRSVHLVNKNTVCCCRIQVCCVVNLLRIKPSTHPPALLHQANYLLADIKQVIKFPPARQEQLQSRHAPPPALHGHITHYPHPHFLLSCLYLTRQTLSRPTQILTSTSHHILPSLHIANRQVISSRRHPSLHHHHQPNVPLLPLNCTIVCVALNLTPLKLPSLPVQFQRA